MMTILKKSAVLALLTFSQVDAFAPSAAILKQGQQGANVALSASVVGAAGKSRCAKDRFFLPFGDTISVIPASYK